MSERLPDNPAARYGPGGSGHRIFWVLGQDPDSCVARSNLQDLADIKRRKGFGFTVEQMVLDRLIRSQASGFYAITWLGLDVLRKLEAGESYVGTQPARSGAPQHGQGARQQAQPSVRYFGSATA